MTISSETSNASFIGDGVTKTFPCAFKVFDEDHVQVFVDGVQKMLGGDFTVSGVGAETFDVVFTVAPAAQAKISIVRVVPMLQETDYLSNDAFPAETHERALDLLVMMVQQVQAGNEGRAIKYPPGDPASLTGILPAAATRASKLLGFDSNGEAVPVVGADLGTFSVGEANTWTAQQIMQVGSNADGWVLRNLSGQTLVKMRNTSGGVGALVVNDGLGNEGRIEAGSVDPEGARGASTGALYLRSSGGSGTTAYLKETGSGNTGWAALGIEQRAQENLSGLQRIIFGSVRARARRIVLLFRDLSTNGTAPLVLQIGTATGFTSTTYHGTCHATGNTDPEPEPHAPTAFRLTTVQAAAKNYSGVIELFSFGASNIWLMKGQVVSEDGTEINWTGGHAVPDGPLTQVNFEPEGADLFDDGNAVLLIQ